jgi:hypothetical protein
MLQGPRLFSPQSRATYRLVARPAIGGNKRGRERFMAVKYIAIWGITAFLAAILAGLLAGVKRRDHSFWAAWSFIAPPMLLVLLCLPKNHGPKPKRRTGQQHDEPFI